MATSYRNFLIELYREYLEEASFLYTQRLALFDNSEITWLDIKTFEDRLEPHIDGLVVGEDLALDVCRQQAIEGDFGELYAAVTLFCRQDRKDLVLAALAELDPEDAERIQAFGDALKHEFPQEWQTDFFQMLPEDDLKSIPILAELFGYRRMKAGMGFLSILEDIPDSYLPRVLWAIGRLGDESARPACSTYLQHQSEAVRAAAATALLRLGDRQTADFCLQHARSASWALVPAALGGNRSGVKGLLELVTVGKVPGELLVALGLLGDLTAIDPLLSHLAQADLAEAAAQALNLITGAEIYEEAFIPEKIDEDELFEEELEKLKQGKAPTRPDGKPFGNTVTRLSQNAVDWRAWWVDNGSHFDPRVRYRHGKPYSPLCLLESLQSEKSRHQVRQLAYEELVIRYGVDVPFEADMFVAQQKKVLGDIARWVQTNIGRFREGAWYFAGQLMS